MATFQFSDLKNYIAIISPIIAVTWFLSTDISDLKGDISKLEQSNQAIISNFQAMLSVQVERTNSQINMLKMQIDNCKCTHRQ